MQWNYTSPFLQNIGYDPFSIGKAPSYPQIIGEGDVTSVILPDGTIQLFFVPTNRHVTLSPFQINTNFPNHCTTNKDIWFVRSISHPLPPSLLNRQFPNVYGGQQPPSQFNSNFCISSAPSPDYYQKFHNDASTSTTDIHYFYPSLRNNEHLRYSEEIQTQPALGKCQCHCGCESTEVKNNLNTNGDALASSTSYMSVGSNKSKHRLTKRNKKKSKTALGKCQCHCGCESTEVKNNLNTNGDALASSTSYMSVGSNKSKHRLTKRNKKKSKTNKSRDSICDCHLEGKKSKHRKNKIKEHNEDSDMETKVSKYKTNRSRDSYDCDFETKQTSDKLVSTFAEKASGSIDTDGRHTQTANKKTKRSDINTEMWLPIDCDSSSTLNLLSVDRCSDRCFCGTTSETDV